MIKLFHFRLSRGGVGCLPSGQFRSLPTLPMAVHEPILGIVQLKVAGQVG